MSGITVTGRVLKVERVAGSFKNDAGEQIAYDHQVARLLVDETDVVEVKFRANRPEVLAPQIGQTVSISVELPRNTKPVAAGYVTTDRAVKAS